MAKIIKYNLNTKINTGTVQEPVWEDTPGSVCTIPFSEANMVIAQSEAYGEVTVEDDGTPEPEVLPSLEDTLLDMVADQEYRLCMLELGGETL